MTWDAQVGVVGLGAAGSAALWRAAARGASVVGFEQHEPGHPHGSSHGHSRLFRTALVEGPQYVDLVRHAHDLWRELERASALLQKPAAELAISHRTRSVIDRKWPPPAGHELETMLVGGGVEIPWLPQRLRTLDDAFGHLVRSLLEISVEAKDGDVVEVSDN